MAEGDLRTFSKCPHDLTSGLFHDEIPLHSSPLSFFKGNLPAPFDANPLFPTLAQVSSKWSKGISSQFKGILSAAGIGRQVTRKAKDGAACERATYSFHCLRHRFTSMLANADVSEEIRSKMTGHIESSSHKIYTHIELETLRKGVERIPGIPAAS